MTNSKGMLPVIEVAEELHSLLYLSDEEDVKIAGGYLRDTFLGRPVKDCDIVLPWSAYGETDIFNALFDEVIETVIEDYIETPLMEFQNRKYMKDGIRYDLIFVRDFYAFFNSFPLNISKIYYSVMDRVITITKEFLEDAEGTKLTIGIALDGMNYRHMSYIERISEKYEGFPIYTDGGEPYQIISQIDDMEVFG